MSKHFITSLLFFLLSLFSCAQENEVSVRFVSFPISDTSEAIELFVGDEKSIKVELPTRNLSPIYKVPAMSHWKLGKMELGKDEKKIFKAYGTVKSAGSQKQLVLVIRKGATYEDGFTLIPLKYDEDNFAGGQYFMMNATQVDIGIQLGATKVALQPNMYKVTKPKGALVVKGNKQMHIKVFFRNEGKLVPFYSSTWRLNDKARNLVFFYHEPHHKRIRTHTIRDYSK